MAFATAEHDFTFVYLNSSSYEHNQADITSAFTDNDLGHRTQAVKKVEAKVLLAQPLRFAASS